MKFDNPNQFEKVRRLEGLRSQEDIWDLGTMDRVKTEIKNKKPDIKENLREHSLSPELKSCLDKTKIFCNELAEEFKQKFLSLLDQYGNERRQISPKIVEYLLEKKFDIPNFNIAYGSRAKELLEEYGFSDEINDQSLLLVFQLPKPLAQYWWKGGTESWGSMAEDVEGAAIEWGHFYRELMPIIWEAQGRHENESGLAFNRINNVGEHNPKKYYYIWKISKWSN